MNSGQSSHLLGCLLMFAAALATDQMPRLTFRKGDSSRIVFSFHRKGVQNYDTFLLSKDGATLYVGARDAILALDIGSPDSIRLKGEILWGPTATKKVECVFKKKSNETECFNFIRVLVQLNDTHLYACGTYAFSPTCTYVDLENFTLATDVNGKPLLLEGKGICPFDPQHQNTAIVVDGELYTGTRNNFQGNEAIITRTLGSRTVLKTDNWLHGDAAFVASFNIPVDDKVYFFFGETAKEFDFFEKLTVSRVARVCKNDVGGDKVLQRKWTTFLKAQLSCTQQGQFPYTVIQHMFALPQPGGGADFYGVFGSQWQAGNLGSSAVCAFRHDAIKKAFDGKYKELNKDCSRWMTYNGQAMNPRPGSCSVGPSSDKALTFMKDHYLMDEKIEPTHNQPLLVKQNVKYTRIVVHQTQNSLGHPYNVMFLGTDKGALHKAVVVGTEAHIIEEIQLFEKPEAVQNLLLSPEKGILYVGYSTGVLQVPLANCSIYTTCANCVLARDPYCGWDGQKCRDIWGATENLNDLVQNIETGKPDPGCQPKSGIGRAIPRTRNGPESSLLTIMTASFNTMVRLPCPQASALANYSWNYPDRKIPDRLILEDDKALVIIVHEETLGLYECWASENGYQQSVARYHVRTHDSPARVDRARESYADGEPVGEYRSYWVQFVTVTVLLSMTLAVVVALAFFSYHDKLKARSKVQGCSSLPDASKASGQEKVPLNSSQIPPQSSEYQMQGPCQEAADSSKTCCVEVGGPFQDIDADNNRLDSGLANGDDSRAVVAAEGI
uniref:semaphorin-4A n=1 Tax=Podarcis muralis TaxID=64176 RepID=UPI0010A028E4|nr:semaphorin-4A [Podarcis muralis]XP_028565609.1 semaphorin-4A [Podarcis muralis]XP_028565610.1 semaphorin-4A [Podarcis muralis]XP_028565611.1 semaphorin-4A [Podarcis muralis]XP_028565612.1 semaphorin-4A [Podarcis muralis]XP_028565613.1 semaphorin-4A [Podarcis muralis]XP_028565615.1 semaphorin-4A [Podarcis muralis]XP_028565616.1 semaphorin-4A [Podarcis muralis]XP_028565617.1 semaphorin-4A [Podarcis muralis]XP_028565618.1 semaphorin-4A [Podarcis muralis]